MHEGLLTVGAKAFESCIALKNVTISSTVESIGDLAFSGCTALEGINVDSNNLYYSSDDFGAFFDKDKTVLFVYPVKNAATEYTVPDSVTEINKNAFYSSKILQKVYFPEGLKKIGDSAFFYSEALTEVFVPASVEYIGDSAFVQCISIEAFTVDENNKYFSSDENNALYNKDKTQLILYPAGKAKSDFIIPDTVTTIKYRAIDYNTHIKKLVISDSVTIIETNGAYQCYIDEIIIGKGLEEIQYAAFARCTIDNITVSEDNNYFCSVDDVLYSKDMSVLYRYPTGKKETQFVIGDTVEKIIQDAFFRTKLTVLIVPNNVTEIGAQAFYNSYFLKDITIVNPAVNIGSLALPTGSDINVYGYQSSTVQQFVNNGNQNFIPLHNGLSVDYADGVLILSGSDELPVIDNDKMCPWAAFADSTECILFRDIAVINENAFASFYGISSLIFESENIRVEDGAFADCNNLKTVICFSDADFAEAAFSEQAENLLFFKESDKAVNVGLDAISFTYDDGVVNFDKPVSIAYYDFFNLIIALCDRYPEINELAFTEFFLLDGTMERVEINGDTADRYLIDSFENDKLAVQIIDEETWEVVTVSFNELCVGVANGKIDKFLLVVIDENGEVSEELPVDTGFLASVERVVTYVLRAIVTFFNKLLRLFMG